MPEWKKNIFVNAIKTRMERESRTANDIINEYTKLSTGEKIAIIDELENDE